MKTRILIIGTIVLLVIGFAYLLYLQYTHYETLGNNEMWYYHPDGYKVECEMQLFQPPGSCKAMDENGIIVDTKTKLGNWNGVKWLQDPDYCKDKGGVWNNVTRGCYGLYDMCEKDGGVPRFLKNSLPFPDIEENKPIEYLMDCYYAYTIEDNYMYESDEKDMFDEILSIKFTPLNLENIELSFDWCTENNGFWNKNDSTCYFKHQKDLDAGMIAVQQYGAEIFGDMENEN